MKIAFMGIRGVPASYSGFETSAEEIGWRLVERGHDVTVYCRSHHIKYPLNTYKGMRLVKLPTITNKYLDTLVHSLISSLHSLNKGYDIVFYSIAGNSPVTWIPRLAGMKTVLNVDGLDWKRDKWPKFAKRYIQFSEMLAAYLPNAFLTDSRTVQDYYLKCFKKKPYYIPYGSEVYPLPPGEYIKKYNLEPRKYILYVGRLVPENKVHHLIEAFSEIDTDMKCVIVGDAPYAEEYVRSIKNCKDERVIFTGYLFGEGYRELNSNAYLFVETSAVGGTHPALLEAMGFGNCVIVNGTKENLETMGEAGFYYNTRMGAKDLVRVIKKLIENPDLVEEYRVKAKEYVTAKYSWDKVTDMYERLFYKLLQKPLPKRLSDVEL